MSGSFHVAFAKLNWSSMSFARADYFPRLGLPTNCEIPCLGIFAQGHERVGQTRRRAKGNCAARSASANWFSKKVALDFERLGVLPELIVTSRNALSIVTHH